ncbi:cathepsin K [Parasteatoda tepidariorum]|uniref:cathepsin K n=1 Tax=Parasteatoda tepidariorum TaxID=114398 RepID=UPI000A2C099A|nr:procathepsin L [Parasteatoda tepidariorum]
MFQVWCILVICAIAWAAPIEPELDDKWQIYKTLYNKTYLSDMDEEERRIIWEENVKLVQRHNLEADLREHDFRLGINHLSDSGLEEYMGINGLILIPSVQTFFETIKRAEEREKERKVEKEEENENYPKHVDWREKGYVTPVQNQGFCGACWAFSAVGSLEAQYKKKTGKLVPLSSQNLVDCSKTTGNLGCRGGGIDSSFLYIRRNRGIDTEESYPYSGKEGECRFKRNNIGAKLKGWVDVKQFNEKALMKAVATVGPVSVGINSEGYGFKHYRSGVYDVPSCNSYMINHGVLVVGYGTTESGTDYWIVKNSWGPTWGEGGYVRMRRNKNNQCGIASLASYPVV